MGDGHESRDHGSDEPPRAAATILELRRAAASCGELRRAVVSAGCIYLGDTEEIPWIAVGVPPGAPAGPRSFAPASDRSIPQLKGLVAPADNPKGTQDLAQGLRHGIRFHGEATSQERTPNDGKMNLRLRI